MFETDNSIDDPGESTIIHEGHNRQECSDRALVLLSVGIPYSIFSNEKNYYALAVPAPFAEKARFEIWEYDQENKPSAAVTTTAITPDYGRAVFGAIGYILILVIITWLSEIAAFAKDWHAAGRIDGSLIRDGEWWRVFTALTLHASTKHLLGNLVFGSLFGMLAGGLVGPGVAWLWIVIAGGAANLLNVFLLDAAHRSIGASTAVFAALGIVSGFVWRAKLMAQERWAWRLGPIVGGIALLAYTGTGDANTDVGAHLAGFACGFGAGTILTALGATSNKPQLQKTSGLLALGIIFSVWLIAL